MNKFFRLGVAACVAGATATGIAMSLPASAASGGLCTLNGTAKFSTPLTTTAKNFSYSFDGQLTNCLAGNSASPGSPLGITGHIQAGNILFHGVTLTQPTGNGSCASSTTSGQAGVDWSNGTWSIVTYTTRGAAAEVALQGSVTQGTAYNGDTALGDFAFNPPDHGVGCTGAGESTAGIQGETGIGSAT